jgi:hypothetical protein
MLRTKQLACDMSDNQPIPSPANSYNSANYLLGCVLQVSDSRKGSFGWQGLHTGLRFHGEAKRGAMQGREND